jgi:D-glycerate 3-kinase
VQGILGGQGTGKTTLGKLLTLILRHLGLNALNWSLDDLYKTFSDRQALQAQDPRLLWRGPPGTHDVALGIATLDRLRQNSNQAIFIRRFDKSLHNGLGDCTTPDPVQNIDIILFEGWFVGVQPIDPAAFDQAPPPILTEADRAFARDVNAWLQDYLPLWQRLDNLWVLHLPDYRLSKQWRKQAEQQMRAMGKPGMRDAEIDAFVDYFWRSLHPVLFMPPALQAADLVIELQPDHSMGRFYRITGAESPLVGDSG